MRPLGRVERRGHSLPAARSGPARSASGAHLAGSFPGGCGTGRWRLFRWRRALSAGVQARAGWSAVRATPAEGDRCEEHAADRGDGGSCCEASPIGGSSRGPPLLLRRDGAYSGLCRSSIRRPKNTLAVVTVFWLEEDAAPESEMRSLMLLLEGGIRFCIEERVRSVPPGEDPERLREKVQAAPESILRDVGTTGGVESNPFKRWASLAGRDNLIGVATIVVSLEQRVLAGDRSAPIDMVFRGDGAHYELYGRVHCIPRADPASGCSAAPQRLW